MSLHAGQEKELWRGQIVIAKVTLERAQCHKLKTSHDKHMVVSLQYKKMIIMGIRLQYRKGRFCNFNYTERE